LNRREGGKEESSSPPVLPSFSVSLELDERYEKPLSDEDVEEEFGMLVL